MSFNILGKYDVQIEINNSVSRDFDELAMWLNNIFTNELRKFNNMLIKLIKNTLVNNLSLMFVNRA